MDQESPRIGLCVEMKGIVAFHLGAGHHSEKKLAKYKELCFHAARKSAACLNAGAQALDLVTDCTAILEDSPLTNAGTGSNLTVEETIECDASVMDGASCAAGAVGALTGIANPVVVAKHLTVEQKKIQKSGRVIPCMLVGEGAFRFAQECGIPAVDPSQLITAQSVRALRKCKRKLERFDSSLHQKSQTTWP